MELYKTQIGKISESIKAAMLGEFPIVYLPTNQRELIQELLYGKDTYGSFIPRLDPEGNLIEWKSDGINPEISSNRGGIDNYYYDLPGDIEDKLSRDGRPRPILYVLMINDKSKIEDHLVNLNRFVSYYFNLRKDSRYFTKGVHDGAHRSLCILVSSTEQNIPASIAPYVYTVDVPPIEDDEIEAIIKEELAAGRITNYVFQKPALLTRLKVVFRGFSALRIRQLMRQMIGLQIIDDNKADDEELVIKSIMANVQKSKRQLMGSIPGLNWEKTDGLDAYGLDNVRKWLEDRAQIFSDPQKARQNHIDIPNAILLTGVPGSGKSLMAKMCARIFNNVPLISLDMGAIRGGLMGESEANMINALKMAETMAPCVLWIDEIEKAFSGSNDSGGDSGVGQRLFGKFLTWMQEKKSSCFVFATSNDVTKLPPELFRSERFDYKAFAFMPNANECASIFAGNIKKQNKDYAEERKSFDKATRKQMPENLFPKKMEDPKFWLPVLDEACLINRESCHLELIKDEAKGIKTYKWKGQGKPCNKLMTGADVSAIIKEAKFQAFSEQQSRSGNVESVYAEEDFKDQIKKTINSHLTYGETNLREIAMCFYSLFKNGFSPASLSPVVDFKNFDEDQMVYTPRGALYTKPDNYDLVLESTIIGAINRYLPELKKTEA